MAYALPPAGSADASWVGAGGYTSPPYSAADATWSPQATAGVAGVVAGTLDFTGVALAAHGVAGIAAGPLAFTGSATAEHAVAGVEGAAAGTLNFTGVASVAHGIAVQAAGALDFAGAGAVAHGIAATCVGAVGFTGSCAAAHLRYEVRGEVRLSNVLVNRRVRCYKRATGDLTGQADTVVGKYRVHAGFDAAEVYVAAIDLADTATDWMPPTANRLVPALADDTA